MAKLEIRCARNRSGAGRGHLAAVPHVAGGEVTVLTAQRLAPAFSLEVDLVDQLVRTDLSGLLGTGTGGHIRREWSVGFRVIDVMLSSTLPPSGLPRQLSGCSALELHCLAALWGRKLSRRSLAARLFLSPSEVDRLASSLLRRRLVSQSRTGALEVGPWRKDLPMDLVAIEAKLTRWREAVDQAAFCRRYAGHSYVALPDSNLSDEALRFAKKAGVGVIVISRDTGPAVRLRAPRSSQGSTHDRALCALRLAADWLRSGHLAPATTS